MALQYKMARVVLYVFYRCPKILWKGVQKDQFRTSCLTHFWWMVLALPKQSLKHSKEIPFIIYIYNMALCLL